MRRKGLVSELFVMGQGREEAPIDRVLGVNFVCKLPTPQAPFRKFRACCRFVAGEKVTAMVSSHFIY